MKKLIIVMSVCVLMTEYIFAMHGAPDISVDATESVKKNSVDEEHVWTKKHTVIYNLISRAESASNYECIRNAIINTKIDVDATNKRGETLLHAAAFFRSSEILDVLLEKNPKNVNAFDEQGFTPFIRFMSRFYDDLDVDNLCKRISNFFIHGIADTKKPINRSMRTGASNSTIDSCFEYDQKKEITELFAEEFKESIYKDYPAMPRGSAKSIIEKFVQCGTDLKVKDPISGYTALHYAAEADDIDALRELLSWIDSISIIDELSNGGYRVLLYEGDSSGIDIDQYTALDLALNRQNIDTIELLTRHSAKVSYQNLRFALGNFYLIKALLPYEDSLRNIENGTQILKYYPMENFQEDMLDFMEEEISFLVNKGASVDAKDDIDFSFLHKFAKHYKGNNEYFVKKVVYASKNIDYQDYSGFTALHWALVMDNQIVARQLFFAGADPYIRNNQDISPEDTAKKILTQVTE